MPDDEVDWTSPEGASPPDPPVVGTTSSGPRPSSPAPDDSTEPHRTTDEAPQGTGAEEPEPLPEFDPRFRDDLDGLLYIGYLTDEFRWLGHAFIIKTLDTDALLEVALIHRDYSDTIADMKAYQAALVAACVVKVDGRPLRVPLSSDPTDTALVNRFAVVRKWFPPTIDMLYERYLLLEDRVAKVIEAMGKVPGLTDSIPTLSAASV